MDPPNADILELKEMMRELFNVVQGLALGQKALVEKVEKLERASASNSGNNQEGTSNNGPGGSRDGGDPRRKATTAGVVLNNGGGFGFAAGGGLGPVGNTLKDTQFPPFFGAVEDKEEDQFSVLNEQFGQYGVPPPNKEIQVLAEKIRALESLEQEEKLSCWRNF